jgi:tripartite-type tricarboxylate transporter receptor subunit TctC
MALLTFIKDGRVKALAATGTKRSNTLPDLPSMAESGPSGFHVMSYFAISAPAGTPGAVINALNGATNKVVQMPEVVARFKLNAVDAAPGSPAQMGRFVEADYAAWRKVVKAQNLKVE